MSRQSLVIVSEGNSLRADNTWSQIAQVLAGNDNEDFYSRCKLCINGKEEVLYGRNGEKLEGLSPNPISEIHSGTLLEQVCEFLRIKSTLSLIYFRGRIVSREGETQLSFGLHKNHYDYLPLDSLFKSLTRVLLEEGKPSHVVVILDLIGGNELVFDSRIRRDLFQIPKRLGVICATSKQNHDSESDQKTILANSLIKGLTQEAMDIFGKVTLDSIIEYLKNKLGQSSLNLHFAYYTTQPIVLCQQEPLISTQASLILNQLFVSTGDKDPLPSTEQTRIASEKESIIENLLSKKFIEKSPQSKERNSEYTFSLTPVGQIVYYLIKKHSIEVQD